MYETGAKTAAANTLVLSVMNNGAIYSDCLHCGYAALQGAEHRVTFRKLANNEAMHQRATMGAKFKASDITNAAAIVEQQTIQHCLETIRENWTGETIHCYGRKWWDKINGNSYFSAEIVLNYGQPNAQTIVLPFQYGYGDAYIYTALRELKERGHITADNTADLRDSGIILRTNKQKNCKKRELAK